MIGGRLKTRTSIDGHGGRSIILSTNYTIGAAFFFLFSLCFFTP